MTLEDMTIFCEAVDRFGEAATEETDKRKPKRGEYRVEV